MSNSRGVGSPAAPTPGGRDLSRSMSSFLVSWGPAILLIMAGTAMAKVPGAPKFAFGLLWSTGALWSGVSCARNALRCGRFHCTVLGVAHPLFGLAAFAITLHLLPLSWNVFWDFAFWPVTVGAFIPELFGLRYLGRIARIRVDRQRAER